MRPSTHTPTPPPPMPDAEGPRCLWAAVRHQAQQAETDGGLDPVVAPRPQLVRLLAHLRSCVVRHAAARRAAGASLDGVLAEVLALAHAAGACEGWRDHSGALLTQVVRWGIEAYDDEAELCHVPGSH